MSTRRRGKTTAITWVVRIDIGNLPDGNNRIVCAASFVLNTLGVGFSLPSSATLAGRSTSPGRCTGTWASTCSA
jgi:hypothetical protein